MPKKSKPAKRTKQIHIDGIRVLPGHSSNVVIVAPHGSFEIKKSGKPHYRNDERTGLIAKTIHDKTDWFTVINDAFIKPNTEPKVKPNLEDKRLDLFKIEQAGMVPGYLEAIKNAVDENEGKTLVIWLHGMTDGSTASMQGSLMKSGVMTAEDGDLHALIGYGQGAHPRLAKLQKPTDKDEDSWPSANETTVSKFRNELTKQGLFTLIAEDGAGNFRGRDPKRLNQWFLNEGYTFDKVESIQIEIREKGFRENLGQCEETAEIIFDDDKENRELFWGTMEFLFREGYIDYASVLGRNEG